MQSIQVSKGSSSVKNGYEAITGQINVEFKKPQNPDADWFSGNLYTSSTGRYEANADATLKLSNKWSTSLLAHYENETMSHDSNHDGFEDIPQVKQYNVWNRWSYLGEHYVFQAGIKALSETRNSGQMSHSDNNQIANPYQIGIETNRYEAFTKNAYIFNKEKNTNVALILSGSLHQQDADYGLKKYNVDQNNEYASLMFETELSKHHSLSTGLSFNYDSYNQHYRFANDASLALTKDFTNESVPGAYIQYTYNLNDKLVLMAGLRGDHSNEYGYFVTPRFHVQFTVIDDIEVMAQLREITYNAIAKAGEEGKITDRLSFIYEFAKLWKKPGVDVIFRGAPHIVITSSPEDCATPAQDMVFLSVLTAIIMKEDGKTASATVLDSRFHHATMYAPESGRMTNTLAKE